MILAARRKAAKRKTTGIEAGYFLLESHSGGLQVFSVIRLCDFFLCGFASLRELIFSRIKIRSAAGYRGCPY